MPSQNAADPARIVLGVTGSIAAYKSCELVRLLRKEGHSVRVVMSRGAEDFVGALSFESLSGQPVLRGFDGAHGLSATAHIDLAQWGEALVVAPATANFIAKYACGIADDALLTEALAFTGPVLLAPAMNTRMWQASVTQENVQRLRARGVQIVGPAHGDLACGETGAGKISEPEEIAQALMARLKGKAPAKAASVPAARSVGLSLEGLRVLVTSGPTRAWLDPVRYISNRSSGRMGHALARAAEEMGAQVTLVTGPVDESFARLERGRVMRVESTQDMLEAARTPARDADIIIGAAAVCDFEAEARQQKIPRGESGLKLQLKSAPDILATLAAARRPGQLFMGFAAETLGDGSERARQKLAKKNLDLLALNNVSRADIGFDSDFNEVTLFAAGADASTQLPRAPKSEIARALLRRACEMRGQA